MLYTVTHIPGQEDTVEEYIPPTDEGAPIDVRRIVSGPPPFVEAPPELPTPNIAFDVTKLKRQVFAQARSAVCASAQYTKRGRMPWTQITVGLPLKRSDDDNDAKSTTDDDLAIIYHFMQRSTREEVIEKDNGDKTWKMNGYEFLLWILDCETFDSLDHDVLPVDKYNHPVKYETGDVERKRLEKKLAKAKAQENVEDEQHWETELAKLDAKQAAKKNNSDDDDMDYHWSMFTQCEVIFKKDKQPRKMKKHPELQLVIRMRTQHWGCGDPKRHGGFMLLSEGNLHDMDPSTRVYALAKRL